MIMKSQRKLFQNQFDATPEFRKVLQLKQDHTGQWMYQVIRNGTVLVSWQHGPFDREECIQQAKSRFGSMEVAQ